MRIIGGRFKRRRMAEPPDAGVRPTSDRLRETLFNILGPAVESARVVDGFAGTGALGLEALSRGAAYVVFVEPGERARQVLRENVRRCGVGSACAVLEEEFLAACADAGSEARKAAADLVLLDPPYDYPDIQEALAAAGVLLGDGGRVVLEHSRRRESPGGVEVLRRSRVLVAGDSALSFYDRDAEGGNRSMP